MPLLRASYPTAAGASTTTNSASAHATAGSPSVSARPSITQTPTFHAISQAKPTPEGTGHYRYVYRPESFPAASAPAVMDSHTRRMSLHDGASNALRADYSTELREPKLRKERRWSGIF